MFRLVTGRIGSGKSQVMSILREKGYKCIGTDDLSRGYRSNPSFFKRTVEIFGKDCLDDNGNISTKFLWKEFMAKSEAFERYDTYTAECVSDYVKSLDSTEPVFIEVALVPKHLNYLLTAVHIEDILLVRTDTDLRKKRLLGRGLSLEQIDFVDSIQGYVDSAWDLHTLFVANNGDMATLTRNVNDALEHCSFTGNERESLFQRLYRESPSYVWANVRCYMYYNMVRCSKCPFPCPRADWHFDEARKEMPYADGNLG